MILLLFFNHSISTLYTRTYSTLCLVHTPIHTLNSTGMLDTIERDTNDNDTSLE